MPVQDASKENNSAEKILEILQSEYNKEFDVARHIDNKASNMLATAGTVTGLLFGFGTFLVSNIKLDYQLLYHAIFLLILAVTLNISSVFLSILAFRMQRYQYVLVPDLFLKKTGYPVKVVEKAENYDDERIDNLVDTNRSLFTRQLIEAYVKCNKINLGINHGKGFKVLLAQWIFVGSLLAIPFLVGIVLHAYTANSIRFN